MASNISPLPSPLVDHPLPDSTSTKHVTLSPEHRYYELALDEEIWRDRYLFLLERGLELRSRYRPGWTPSWLGTNIIPEYCEDSKRKTLHPVLDAKRQQDNAVVCIKRIEPKNDDHKFARMEVEIGRYLSTEQMLGDPTNHCVPIMDHFRDPTDLTIEYIVMPNLRPFNDPAFGVIGEVIDFVSQVLEGMNFMHRHLVAHGDLTAQNIMMDAHPILPHGWHFADRDCAPNGVDPIAPLARMDHPVRYIIIDYDYSIRFRPGQSHFVEDVWVYKKDPPESYTPLYYDAFKQDVFDLGKLFNKDLHEVYEGLEFLKPQIDFMKTPRSQFCPSAQIALDRWLDTRSKLDVSIARWRLRRRNESMGERALLDAIAAARGGIHNMKTMLNPQRQVRTWSNP